MPRTVLLEDVSHKDIGKTICFASVIAEIHAEFRGTLAGIDRFDVSLKEAEFRKLPDGSWQPTADRNPSIKIEDNTKITIFEEDDLE